jgi:hypothetical protein
MVRRGLFRIGRPFFVLLGYRKLPSSVGMGKIRQRIGPIMISKPSKPSKPVLTSLLPLTLPSAVALPPSSPTHDSKV